MTLMDLQFLIPELLLFTVSLVVLVMGVLKVSKLWTAFAAYSAVCASLLLLILSPHSAGSFFHGLLHADALTLFFRFLILVATIFAVFISFEFEQIEDDDRGEFYFFLLNLAASMMIAVASHNLMMLYIAVEAVSIISYVMIGFLKNDGFSSEAALKYFIFGALSTGIMLYGISLFYGLCQSLDITDISVASFAGGAHVPIFILASILVLAGLLFKCSVAPFHFAVPDAYQGAPTPVTVFLSIASKAMGFAVLIRFLLSGPTVMLEQWGGVAVIISIITMTVANITALKQNNVKRMLAYSSIAHAGFMLIALASLSSIGLRSLFFYLMVYVFMNVGAFGCAIYVNRQEIDEFAGLSRKQPLTAFIMAVALLSLAGLPPLAGFMAKFILLAAAVEAKLYFLAIAAVLNSVVALFYYLRIIKVMYFHEPKEDFPKTFSPVLLSALLLTVFANIILGIFPQFILQWLPM